MWSDTEGGSGSNPSPDADLSSSSPSRSEQASGRRYQILVIEDNEADIFLIQSAINAQEMQVDLHVVRDGAAAIEYFDKADKDPVGACADLILLDLNLPKMNGDEVLRHMRSGRKCCNVPVLVVTSSNSPKDRSAVSALNANDYFRKPSDYLDYLKLGGVVKKLLGRQA